MWGFGSNNFGQVGVGTTPQAPNYSGGAVEAIPVRIPLVCGKQIVALAAGEERHICTLHNIYTHFYTRTHAHALTQVPQLLCVTHRGAPDLPCISQAYMYIT